MKGFIRSFGALICSVASIMASATAVLGYLGIGPRAVVAFVRGAPVPTLMAFVAVTSFAAGLLLGICASQAVNAAGKPRKMSRRQMVRHLDREFAAMSRRRKAIVLIACANGSVKLQSYDQDGAALCKLGLLDPPPFMSPVNGMVLAINPTVYELVEKHGKRWLGDFTPDEAWGLMGRSGL